MSKYIKVTKNGLIIECGYDRPMDYVFVQVIKNNEYLYSNINDFDIDFTSQIDFTYFDQMINSLGLEIPEDLKIKVLQDRAEAINKMNDIPSQIKARHAEEIGENNKPFGIEIGQMSNSFFWLFIVIDYEYFHKKSEALTRMNQINGAFINDWDDLNG